MPQHIHNPDMDNNKAPAVSPALARKNRRLAVVLALLAAAIYAGYIVTYYFINT